MAATFTVSRVAARRDANKRVVVADVTVSGTYTTGGDSFAASLSGVGLKVIEEFNPHGGASDGTLFYPIQPVYPAAKTSVTVKLFETGSAAAGSAEKGSGESLTGVTFRVTIVGF